MVEFADKFYLIAYAMIFPVGVAAFIIAYKSQYDSGARGATLFGAPLLITFLALLPLFIFQELKNDPVFVWASCILLIVIIAIIIGAFRFQLGYLWANRKLITVILLILSIFSAAWSARSVELTVCLCAGDSNFFIKIVAVILGIIYTVTYVALYFYFLSSMVDRVERKPFKKSGIAFFGKRLSSRSAKTRGEVMYILGRVKEEWAWRLLIRQAINDEDAELREKALERVKKAGLPPEFLAAAGVAPQDMSRFADSQQPAAGTDTVPQQQQPAAGVAPQDMSRFADSQPTAGVDTAPQQQQPTAGVANNSSAPPQFQQAADYGAYAAPQQPAVGGAPAGRPGVRFCTNCGTPIKEHENFCPQCGNRASSS